MTWRILITLGLLAVCSANLRAAADEPADVPVNDADKTPPADAVQYDTDIRPILETRCIACHGPEKMHGSLRLDSRTALVKGGDSRKDLLQTPLAENEIIRRLRSTEPGDGMPLEGPPLDEASIAAIGRWIEQEAPWPQPKPSVAAQDDDDGGLLAVLLTSFYQSSFLSTFWPALAALAAVLVLVLVLERARVTRRKQLARGKPVSRWAERLSRVSRAWQLVAVLAVAILACFLHLRDRSATIDRLRREIAGTRAALDERMNTEVKRRLRPPHPPRMFGEYYRGNDERSPGLFNGGLYRTCTFRVALVDPTGKQIRWGDALPEKATIRLEIEQSPFASATLFTSDIMGHVGLSSIPPDDMPANADDTAYIQLRPADDYADGHGKWVVEHPAEFPADRTKHDGMLYLYKDLRASDGKLNGDCHYAVGYKLVLDDHGQLTRESEVWMESVFNGVAIDWTDDSMIAPGEWFDSRPIPEIVGGNTSDPKLIGEDEHLEKP